MRILFIILIGIASSCTAQRKSTNSSQSENLQYYSDSCKKYFDYSRVYLNDSLVIEQHNDVKDTLLLSNERMYKISNGISYKIIDVAEDFSDVKKNPNYYYFGTLANDTLQKKGETEIQYKLRLQQSIILLVPIKRMKVDNREIFMYYTISDCYPSSREKCIQAKIINGQYSIVYFEKRIGYVGFAAGQSGCTYMLTKQSYSKVSKQ